MSRAARRIASSESALRGIADIGRVQQTRLGQFAQQQCLLVFLAQRRVIGGHAALREQVGQHALVRRTSGACPAMPGGNRRCRQRAPGWPGAAAPGRTVVRFERGDDGASRRQRRPRPIGGGRPHFIAQDVGGAQRAAVLPGAHRMPIRARRYGSSLRCGEASGDWSASACSSALTPTIRVETDNSAPSACTSSR